MTAKKWHWRARTCALFISTQIPRNHSFEILFCTSILPLAELIGLRPDLVGLRKIVYFHENQLEFPVRVTKERDFQYGFNEIMTCLAADKVLFNSCFNRDSFLSHITSHLKLQPDYKLKDLDLVIQTKCSVVYYPLDLMTIDSYILPENKEDHRELCIVWPHRWEFDKNPEAFYRVLYRLDENGYNFKVIILGESFSDKPEVFKQLLNKFNSRLLHCGFTDNVADYYKFLQNADVVVSTAIHEFFGVAVLEAVYCGCIPVVPKRLSYLELYQTEETYDSEDELYEILAFLCLKKQKGHIDKNYRYLALPFDSTKWFKTLLEVMEYRIS